LIIKEQITSHSRKPNSSDDLQVLDLQDPAPHPTKKGQNHGTVASCANP